jgi:hypothetical protein
MASASANPLPHMPIGVCGGNNENECMCGMYRDQNPGATYLDFRHHVGVFDDYAGICCGFCSQECQVLRAADRVEVRHTHFLAEVASIAGAVLPAVEDEMAAAIAASLATVNLDEDRRRGLVRSEYDELNMAHKQKNISGLISLLETAMPPVSARFSDVAAFLPPLNNITGENGEFMDGLRVASDSFLTSLQGSTEFDRSFESPEQKQRMVELVQELCKML